MFPSGGSEDRTTCLTREVQQELRESILSDSHRVEPSYVSSSPSSRPGGLFPTSVHCRVMRQPLLGESVNSGLTPSEFPASALRHALHKSHGRASTCSCRCHTQSARHRRRIRRRFSLTSKGTAPTRYDLPECLDLFSHVLPQFSTLGVFVFDILVKTVENAQQLPPDQPSKRQRLSRAPKPDHKRRLHLAVFRVTCGPKLTKTRSRKVSASVASPTATPRHFRVHRCQTPSQGSSSIGKALAVVLQKKKKRDREAQRF